MTISSNEKKEFVANVEMYIAGSMSHENIANYAWNLANRSTTKQQSTDKLFWSIVFSTIHLADEQHWNDGCTITELRTVITSLNSQLQ